MINSVCLTESLILQAAQSFKVLLLDLGIISNCTSDKFVKSEEKKIHRAV